MQLTKISIGTESAEMRLTRILNNPNEFDDLDTRLSFEVFLDEFLNARKRVSDSTTADNEDRS